LFSATCFKSDGDMTMYRWNNVSTKLLAILLLFVFSNTLPASSKAEIGQIIAIRGQAIAIDALKVSRTLSLKTKVNTGDLIKTSKRSRLQIMFTDNTIISLGPVSEFMVKDYAWDSEKQQGRMTSQVNEGIFRVLGGSITKTSAQNFTTETPSATIGIRGSMYAGKVRNGKLDVVFQGGKGIYVRNPQGSIDISTPGFGIKNITQNQPPSDPVPFTAADMDALDPLTSSEAEAQQQSTSTESSNTESTTETESIDNGDDQVATNNDTQTSNTDQTEAPSATLSAQSTDPLPLPAIDPPAQTTTTDILKEPLTTTAGGIASISGRYSAVQDDQQVSVNIADLSWLGSLSGQTSAGKLSSTATTNKGNFAITPFTVNNYDPSLSYTGFTKVSRQTRTLTLLGTSNTFNTAETITDNTGEFSVFTLNTLFNSPSYKYRELGFLGTPTLTLPSTGINRYTGPLLGTLNSLISTDFESFGQSFELEVNWHNGKIFGVVIPNSANTGNGFFFGDISGTGMTVTKVFGNDIVDVGPGPILAIDGSSSFAQFYGNQASGVGFVANGNTYNILSQATLENWQLTAAGFRNRTTAVSSTGTVSWKGFAIGVGEDMNQIDVDRRLFMNQNANDFSLTINRDTGNISGTLNAIDAAPSTAALNNLQFGGSNGSAYISEHILATGIGGGTPVFAGSSGPLKTHGNYLITEKPSDQLANYASWGSWEIAYTEPGSGDEYHVHMPGSLWVAGEPTSASDFATLNFSATYNGRAEGVHIPSTGQYNHMPSGTSSFNVNFNTGMLTAGSINFPAGNGAPALNVSIAPTTVSSAGFSATISTPNTGTVNGAFYGPAAASTAGNFAAQAGTDRFIGVFGADR